MDRKYLLIAIIGIILFSLPSLAEAALDTGINQTGNHTAFSVTSTTFIDVVGANLSLTSTAAGTYYGFFIAEARTNWSTAYGQANIIVDGVTIGTYNLTASTTFTATPLMFAAAVASGNHYLTVQMAVQNVSGKQRVMFVDKWNMTVSFMRNFDVNGSAQLTIPQVTNLQETLDGANNTAAVNDTNINSTIAERTTEFRSNDTNINSTLSERTTEFRSNDTNINSTLSERTTEFRSNDSYFNSSEFAGSRSFRNDSINQGVRTTDSPTFINTTVRYSIADSYETTAGANLTNPEVENSYIIYKPWYLAGIVTVAKNGSTGKWDFVGTDTNATIQSAIDAGPAGCIFIKSGTYKVNLFLRNSTCLLGETRPRWTVKTILQNNTNNPTISTPASADGTRDFYIHGLKISRGAEPDTAINFLDASYFQMSENIVFGKTIIAKQAATVAWVNNLYNNEFDGRVEAQTSTDNVWLNNWYNTNRLDTEYLLRPGSTNFINGGYFWSNYSAIAILINGTVGGVTVTGGVHFDEGGYPYTILLENTNFWGNNIVSNNFFYKQNGTAIRISSNSNTISGNTFYYTGATAPNYTVGDINLTIGDAREVKLNTISGNIHYSDPSAHTLYMINEDTSNASVGLNIIYGNSMRAWGYNYTFNNINSMNTDTLKNTNLNGGQARTENYGTGVIANNGYIAHGLLAQPHAYTLTPEANNVSAAGVWVNATHIKVSLNFLNTTPVTDPVNVYWWARI